MRALLVHGALPLPTGDPERMMGQYAPAPLPARTPRDRAGGARSRYCWYSRDEIRPYVEPLPGPTTDAFAALAQRYDCYVVIGLPEVAAS